MTTADRPRSLTFLIPIAHPERSTTGSYDTVEAILRQTIHSLTRVRDAEVRVVVVCHRAPDWQGDCPGSVTFLTLGDHPGFAANQHLRLRDFAANERQLSRDKGRKYMAGLLWAMADHNPDLVMPMDGDDFVRGDIASVAFDQLPLAEGRHGMHMLTGYELALRPRPGGFEVNAAFRIQSFHQACGSCRIFDRDRLWPLVEAQCPPALLSAPVADPDGRLDRAFLDRLVDFAETAGEEDPHNVLEVIGRHIAQAALFSLAPLHVPVAAKGCGHGNHVGQRRGEIHWRRILAAEPIDRVRAAFGLDDSAALVTRPDLRVRLHGAWGQLYCTIKRHWPWKG